MNARMLDTAIISLSSIATGIFGRESFKNLRHDRPPPSCCPARSPLDSDLASDGFICIKLSRGQLFDATQMLNPTRRLPRMLCGGIINGLRRLIENEQAAALRRTQRTPVDPYCKEGVPNKTTF